MEGMMFEDFKQKALELGNAKIQVDGGHPVDLKTWNGVSNFADSGPGDINMVSVTYYLDGKRVRVHRTLHKDIWYTLS